MWTTKGWNEIDNNKEIIIVYCIQKDILNHLTALPQGHAVKTTVGTATPLTKHNALVVL